MSKASPDPVSAPAARRERQKEETRARILDAARDLFVKNGVEATTMRAIASRISYTPTAIYHHFRDKESLLNELCALDFRALAGALVRIGSIDDPLERVRRMGMAYAQFALENKSQYQFMFMTQSSHLMQKNGIEQKNPQEDAYAFLVLTVEEGLKKGLFRSDFQDEHQLAQILWGGLHGIVSLHLVLSHDPWIEWRDPLATVRLSIEAMLRGTRRN